MFSQNDTKTFALLFVLAVLLCGVLIFVAFRVLFGTNNTNDSGVDYLSSESQTELNVSDLNNNEATTSTLIDLEQPNNLDWRQEINEYKSSETSDLEVYDYVKSSAESEASQEVAISSESEVKAESYIPPVVDIKLPDVPVLPSSVEVDIDSQITYKNLEVADWSDCGQIEMPTGFALAIFAYTAGSNPTSICLGEAVAEKCQSTQAELISDGAVVSTIALTELPDNKCGVGIFNSKSQVTLCSVEKIMNSTSEIKKSLSDWQKVFKKSPGQTFASMYLNNQDAFSNPEAAIQFDCETFNLNVRG